MPRKNRLYSKRVRKNMKNRRLNSRKKNFKKISSGGANKLGPTGRPKGRSPREQRGRRPSSNKSPGPSGSPRKPNGKPIGLLHRGPLGTKLNGRSSSPNESPRSPCVKPIVKEKSDDKKSICDINCNLCNGHIGVCDETCRYKSDFLGVYCTKKEKNQPFCPSGTVHCEIKEAYRDHCFKQAIKQAESNAIKKKISDMPLKKSTYEEDREEEKRLSEQNTRFTADRIERCTPIVINPDNFIIKKLNLEEISTKLKGKCKKFENQTSICDFLEKIFKLDKDNEIISINNIIENYNIKYYSQFKKYFEFFNIIQNKKEGWNFPGKYYKSTNCEEISDERNKMRNDIIVVLKNFGLFIRTSNYISKKNIKDYIFIRVIDALKELIETEGDIERINISSKIEDTLKECREYLNQLLTLTLKEKDLDYLMNGMRSNLLTKPVYDEYTLFIDTVLDYVPKSDPSLDKYIKGFNYFVTGINNYFLFMSNLEEILEFLFPTQEIKPKTISDFESFSSLFYECKKVYESEYVKEHKCQKKN